MSDTRSEHPMRRESDFAIERVEKILDSLNNQFQRREGDLGRINQKLDDAIELFKNHVVSDEKLSTACQVGFDRRIVKLEGATEDLGRFKTTVDPGIKVVAGLFMAAATYGVYALCKLMIILIRHTPQ